jgi:hypothetical protein
VSVPLRVHWPLFPSTGSNGDGFLFHDRTGTFNPIEHTLTLDEFPCPDTLFAHYRTAARDVSQNSWIQRGSVSHQYGSSGSCPGSSAPFSVDLHDGHSFWPGPPPQVHSTTA